MEETPKCAISRIFEVAKVAGWKCEETYDYEAHELNERTLAIGGFRYPTLISPDGSVKIALSNTFIYFRPERSHVYLGDSNMTEPDYVTIAGVTTDPSQRRQGKATAAVKQLLAWAKECAVNRIRLEPVRISKLIGKKKSDAPNEKQLAKWYISLGFRQLEKGRNSILVLGPVES